MRFFHQCMVVFQFSRQQRFVIIQIQLNPAVLGDESQEQFRIEAGRSNLMRFEAAASSFNSVADCAKLSGGIHTNDRRIALDWNLALIQIDLPNYCCSSIFTSVLEA